MKRINITLEEKEYIEIMNLYSYYESKGLKKGACFIAALKAGMKNKNELLKEALK